MTAGDDRHRSWGAPIEVIRPGGVTPVARDENRRHGAAPAATMTHIALQEALHGKTADAHA